jgi:hypothetical protein
MIAIGSTVTISYGLFVPKPSTGGDCQRRSIPGLGQTVRECPRRSGATTVHELLIRRLCREFQQPGHLLAGLPGWFLLASVIFPCFAALYGQKSGHLRLCRARHDFCRSSECVGGTRLTHLAAMAPSAVVLELGEKMRGMICP